MKPTGTGSSRGPRPRGMGAQMFNSYRCVRVEHFFGVPAESIFGGVKSRPRLFRSYTHTHATPARRVFRKRNVIKYAKKRGLPMAVPYVRCQLSSQRSSSSSSFTTSSAASSTIPSSTVFARSGRMGRRAKRGMPNSFAVSSALLGPNISALRPQPGHS